MSILDKLEAKAWLELNAKLQTKKSVLRKSLSERGILRREGNNSYDKYKYFSEAQYKLLFDELMPQAGLELKFTEMDYGLFTGPDKQPNGRMPKLSFTLFDTETGFFEETEITGEGVDKGDKAGYKAYTGALKYYLANTFMVATGDDPEVAEEDSADQKEGNRKPIQKKARPQEARQEKPKEDLKSYQADIAYILKEATKEQTMKILDKYKIDDVRKLTPADARKMVILINKRKTEQMEVAG